MIVVDDTLEIARAARHLFASGESRLAFAGSLHELPLVMQARGAPTVVLINVAGDITAHEVATRLERWSYRGRVVAFVENHDDAAMQSLTRLSHVRCIRRPASPEALNTVLQELMTITPTTIGDSSPGLIRPEPRRVTFHGIVGRSAKLQEIFARVEKVATGDANVCVCGESGTGKELIARAIHYASPRRDGPLITLDSTTIPHGLMESHLLGHVKGAFTGAVDQREGVFSLAHTGTLFIDELCELELPLQAKLLRVIQNREFVRVGGTKPIRTDVRLITATNKDPKREVERGTFREDLYYRIAVFMINVPPLRERRDDIPLLVEHFLAKFARTYRKSIGDVEPRAMKRLEALPWPGNIRQLENCVEQAVVLADGDVLTERDLFAHEGLSEAPVSSAAIYEPGLPLREVERRHIFRTLQKVGGNRTEAARLLRISLRGLQYKLKEYLEEPNGQREVSL